MTLNPAQPTYAKLAIASGTITAATSTTVTDSNASFPNLVNAYVTVISSSNAYAQQTAKITSNTSTVITTAAWGTTPSVGDAYYVFESVNNSLATYFSLSDGRQIGTANTQLQFVVQTYSSQQLAIIVQSSGGNFASQNMTVEISADNTNFITVDTVALGTSTSKAVQYDNTHLASTLAINPADFAYIRITVPALGVGITATVTYGMS